MSWLHAPQIERTNALTQLPDASPNWETFEPRQHSGAQRLCLLSSSHGDRPRHAPPEEASHIVGFQNCGLRALASTALAAGRCRSLKTSIPTWRPAEIPEFLTGWGLGLKLESYLGVKLRLLDGWLDILSAVCRGLPRGIKYPISPQRPAAWLLADTQSSSSIETAHSPANKRGMWAGH